MAATVTVVVPQGVDEFRFALVDGTETIGVFQQKVRLQGVNELVLPNPVWIDCPDFISSIVLVAQPATIRETEQADLIVTANLEGGGTHDVTAFAELLSLSDGLSVSGRTATGVTTGSASVRATLFFLQDEFNIQVEELPFFETLTLLSKDFETGEAVTDVTSSSISFQGWSGNSRYAVFSSDSGRIVEGDANGRTDLFLYDTQTGNSELRPKSI